MRIFQTVRISAIPVVDENKRLRDIYSKFDIMVRRTDSNLRSFSFVFQHLAATRTYGNLDVPLAEILDAIHDHQTYQLVTCHLTDQLFELMDRFVTREVRN